MTFEEIIAQAGKQEFYPIYFLHGEEPYFIDKIADTVQQYALKEEERGFNETILYGKDTDVINLIHAAKRYPMGAPRQLIILREAQQLDKIEMLENYFEHPQPSTILVICYKYKSPDKRTKFFNALKKQKLALIFESKKLYENQMAQWISEHVRSRSRTIDPKAAVMLVDFLGNELEKVVQAIDKLEVVLGPSAKHITVDHVSDNIGINKEYNTFELQNAILNKDVLKANRIVKVFAANPNEYPMPAIVSLLFSFFSKVLLFHYLPDKNNKDAVASALKIHPFFVKDYQMAARNYKGIKVLEIISLLREYDMKSKGYGNVNASGGDLLRELVFKIMH
ncbi:MAG: DNA polymerase III subunit delta [Bacteroidota bacterium]|nr:DNA polymerase III subunit delta [Bacteroidota bacterium]